MPHRQCKVAFITLKKPFGKLTKENTSFRNTVEILSVIFEHILTLLHVIDWVKHTCTMMSVINDLRIKPWYKADTENKTAIHALA